MTDEPQEAFGSALPKPKIWETLPDLIVRRDKEYAEKMEQIAGALADGKLATPAKIRKFCEKLGISTKDMARVKMTDGMAKRVGELLRKKALYAAANALDCQAELAKSDVQSFKTVLQVAEVLASGGLKVETNVAIDARTKGDTHSDRVFFEQHQKRLEAVKNGDAGQDSS